MSAAGNKFFNIVGNAKTTIKSGQGVLRSIVINNNMTGGTITVYDNIADSGTKIMTLYVGSPTGGLLSSSGIPGPCILTPIDIEFHTGLTIVTSGASANNVTVIYE